MEDSRRTPVSSTALGSVPAAETFYLCALECVVPRLRPVRAHTHNAILSHGSVCFHAHKSNYRSELCYCYYSTVIV